MMKMRFILTSLFLFLFFQASVAQHNIEGTFSGYLHKNLILLEYFGDKHRFIDSTSTDGNGWFSFELNENTASGLYSLAIGKTPLFNVIYNQEDVTLRFDLNQYSMPEFIFSAENLIYYDYLFNTEKYKHKTDILIDILQYYPENDSFYAYSQQHFYNVQLAHREYTDRILADYPGTFVSHIIRSDRPVMMPENFNWEQYHSFNQIHFLDEVDFSDTVLINTNILSGKAIDYMGFYSMSNSNKELQEQFFIQAVDTILLKAMENGKVYNFLMQYLIEGFEMYGFDKVISHIAATYEPANTCINEDRKSELQKRVENLREMAVGNTAPQIEIQGLNGGITTLESIEKEYTVVLFWASWCPHCNAMIPEIKDIYNDDSFPDFEVLAISLDTNATDYSDALFFHNTSWMNYSDFKGWDSKAAIDYNIYATPTMFLLNRNRKILDRPVSANDLRNALNKLSEK